MTTAELESLIDEMLHGRAEGRGERLTSRLFKEAVRKAGSPQPVTDAITRAFIAAEGIGDAPSVVLHRLRNVVITLAGALEKPVPAGETVWFSRGPAGDTEPEVSECETHLLNVLSQVANGPDPSRRTIDVCVFNLTSNSLADALLEAHRNGVACRVITDADNCDPDDGADALRLAKAGIAVKVEPIDSDMHHKFAVIGRRRVIFGSYNWTRRAAERNFESLFDTDSRKVVEKFSNEFELLWAAFDDLRAKVPVRPPRRRNRR